MSINDLLGEPTPLPKEHRFTPRSPVSIKELLGILGLIAVLWGGYEKLNKYAEKTSVEKVVETQWLMRMEAQNDRLETRAALKAITDALTQRQTETPKHRP